MERFWKKERSAALSRIYACMDDAQSFFTIAKTNVMVASAGPVKSLDLKLGLISFFFL